MPDIGSLQAEIDRLSRIASNWNTAIIVLMVCAAGSAAGLVIAQKFAFKYAEMAAFSSGRLSTLKESIADGKTATARKEAEQARRDAEQANERAAILEKAAGSLRERAAAAELATARLDTQIQPRRYAADEQEAIVKACAAFPGHQIAIRSLPYDVEGAIFATSLAELLQTRTKLVVNASGVGDNFIQNLPMVLDVRVQGPPLEQPLINALTEALATQWVTVSSPEPSPRLTILVGAKRLAPAS